MKKTLKFIIKTFSLIFVLFLILGFGIYTKYRLELNNVEELVEEYTPSLPTVLYDKNGEVIDTLYEESRELVKISEVPDNLKNAFLSIEDKSFYNHFGVNPIRILGALIHDIKIGKAAQGASTLTQQLAKNAFLTSEKKLSRKIKELIITIEIERKYTKDEIFEKYLNEIYYGSGYYGVKTAAKNFLKKDLSELNIAESALLAGIPNRPSKYDPINKLDSAIQRQRVVLKEMYEDKKITKEEYEKALQHKFVVEDDGVVADENTSIIYRKSKKQFYFNPEVTGAVEDFLQEILPENSIYRGGFKVYTTVDLQHQKIAKNVFENYSVLKNKDLDGGMITVDPLGGIVSMVGGKDFKAKNFNRALMAKRQVGSAIKPFVYLNALNNGYAPTNVLEDKYIAYGKWAPKNYGGKYSGNNTLVTALNKSINTIAIKLLEGTGTEKFNEFAKQLSFDGEVKDLTAALGTVEATPLRLALNYAIFINGGYKIDSYIVKSVEDSFGKVVYEKEINNEKIVEPSDASVITAMLKNVVANGTASGARVYKNGKPIEQGGKTGTTNENRTVWFAGITPEYVTVAYIGRDDNKPIYGRFTGGGSVAPLWKNYYQELINQKLYDPGKFSYLADSLETGNVTEQSIDLYTGLISSEGSKVVSKRGNIQVESSEKYSNGIATLFNMDDYVIGNSSPYVEQEFNEEDTIKEIPGTFNPEADIVDENNSFDNMSEDNLFDRLLGN